MEVDQFRLLSNPRCQEVVVLLVASRRSGLESQKNHAGWQGVHSVQTASAWPQCLSNITKCSQAHYSCKGMSSKIYFYFQRVVTQANTHLCSSECTWWRDEIWHLGWDKMLLFPSVWWHCTTMVFVSFSFYCYLHYQNVCISTVTGVNTT